tara:strand:- start:1189 stop:1611 length:423 start_codon:yes stop_codon:yes gene_type:complete
MRTKLLATLACLTLLLPLQVSYAQEPSLQLLVDDTVIIGIVTKSDGGPAADLSLLLQDSSHSQSAATILKTDAAGVFMYTGEALTEYRASAVVDGRTISATASTGEGPPVPFQWPPIYVTLGALLLLSLIPAHFLKREDA